jgi:hypothetical protein
MLIEAGFSINNILAKCHLIGLHLANCRGTPKQGLVTVGDGE